MSFTLVLGGMRSGKSAYATELVRRHGGRVAVVATAMASDDEMRARIDVHRRSRPADWTVHEECCAIAEAVPAGSADVVLLDSVDGWLANRCDADECTRAVRALREKVPALVAVSSEVGMSLVPLTAVGRAFTDALGTVNQQLAEEADHVILVVAGLPVVLRQPCT